MLTLKIVNAVRQCCCVEAECHFCYLRDFACGILSEYFTRLHSHPTLPRHDVGSIVDLGQSTHPQSHPASLALFRGSSITHAPVGPSIHLTNPSTNHDVQTIADRVSHPVPAICRSRKTAPTLRSIRVQFRLAGRSLARQQSPLGEARHIGNSASASSFRRLPQSLNRSLQLRRLAGPPAPLRIRRIRLPDGFPWRALKEPRQGLPVTQRTDCLG